MWDDHERFFVMIPRNLKLQLISSHSGRGVCYRLLSFSAIEDQLFGFADGEQQVIFCPPLCRISDCFESGQWWWCRLQTSQQGPLHGLHSNLHHEQEWTDHIILEHSNEGEWRRCNCQSELSGVPFVRRSNIPVWSLVLKLIRFLGEIVSNAEFSKEHNSVDVTFKVCEN